MTQIWFSRGGGLRIVLTRRGIVEGLEPVGGGAGVREGRRAGPTTMSRSWGSGS
jgi:hypothetical protein